MITAAELVACLIESVFSIRKRVADNEVQKNVTNKRKNSGKKNQLYVVT